MVVSSLVFVHELVYILYGNYVNLFQCTFGFHDMKFKHCSTFFIDGICVVALAFTTNTMSGATFHPLVMMLFTSNWYFVVLLLTQRVSVANGECYHVSGDM